jgi:membrane-associated protease RseP (regulator of RpoE activity)
VSLAANFGTERQGPVDSLRASGTVMKQFLVGIKLTVTEKLGSITKLYSSDRDPEGFVGIVGAGRISGEVLASTETGGVKALSFVLLVASLNLFVGLFNLLPLLPLDGGHIAVVLYESARDRIRRRRGYHGVIQRVDYNKLLPVTYGVAGTFLVLTLFILGADLVNPIRIT